MPFHELLQYNWFFNLICDSERLKFPMTDIWPSLQKKFSFLVKQLNLYVMSKWLDDNGGCKMIWIVFWSLMFMNVTPMYLLYFLMDDQEWMFLMFCKWSSLVNSITHYGSCFVHDSWVCILTFDSYSNMYKEFEKNTTDLIYSKVLSWLVWHGS
jgi:hypothetical protein